MPTLFDVFTPSSPAIGDVYIDRPYLDRQLNRALMTPGMQMIIYGSSGTGKSSLILNKYGTFFDGCIKSICQKDTLFNDLIESGFDQLNEFYTTEHNEGNSLSLTGSVSASFWNMISGNLQGQKINNDSVSQSRVTSFKLNEGNLARLLKENNFCWIIEDFHKVKQGEKEKLADSLKLFTDEVCKVIAIGAVNSASEVLELNSELENRVSQLHVPTMEHAELIQIIERGEKIMNIRISPEVKSMIAVFSSGYAAKCHQLCLNLCENHEIYEPASQVITIGIKEFKKALSDYIYNLSDRFRRKLNKVIKEKENTIILHVDIIKYYVFEMQISTALYPIHDKLSKFNTYNISEIESALNRMTTSTHGEVLKKEYGDFKYSFADPFFLYYCITQYTDVIDIPEFDDFQLEIINTMNSCEIMRYIHHYDEIEEIRTNQNTSNKR